MKNFRCLTGLALAALCCVSVVSPFVPAAVAAEASEGQPAGTVIVPDGLKASDVQHSILEAAIGRNWTVKSKDDGRVKIFQENGRWVSLLTLVYDTKEVQIYSSSTRSGKPAVPDWIKYLKQDLTKSMNAKALLK
jgi:hypothetical protein